MDTSPQALRRYAAEERLLDGRTVQIRAIRPDDKQALQDGMHRLTPQSAYFRFFRAKRELSAEELAYFTELDFRRQVALAATLREDGAELLVAVGRYFVLEAAAPRAAELAFAVDDTHQGLGIATLLLRHLASIARASGITELRASVLAENRKMLEVFFRSGLPVEHTSAAAVVELRLSLVP